MQILNLLLALQILALLADGSARATPGSAPSGDSWNPVVEIRSGFVFGESRLATDGALPGDQLSIVADEVELLPPLTPQTIRGLDLFVVQGLSSSGSYPWDSGDLECGGTTSCYPSATLLVSGADGATEPLLTADIPKFQTQWITSCPGAATSGGSVNWAGGTLRAELGLDSSAPASLSVSTYGPVHPQDARQGVIFYFNATVSIYGTTPVQAITWGAMKALR